MTVEIITPSETILVEDATEVRGNKKKLEVSTATEEQEYDMTQVTFTVTP